METGPEPVVVSIGERPAGEEGTRAHPLVPGGFAKLFNRVIDGGAWASLPDAGRAIYVPLVRFADGRIVASEVNATRKSPAEVSW